MNIKQRNEHVEQADAKRYEVVPQAQVDATINAQREAVRQEQVNELDLRTRLCLASYGVKTLLEYNRASSAGRPQQPVTVRLRDGREMKMSIDTAMQCILRGAGTLVEP